MTTPDRSSRLFLIRWAVHAVAVLVATVALPGIECESPAGMFAAMVILGLLNAFVRPVLFVLSLPLVVVTLGLFLWVINAALLYFVGWVVEPFHVAGFGWALAGAAVISVVATLLGTGLGVNSVIARSPNTRAGARGPTFRGTRQPPDRDGSGGGGGGGPVIDV